MAVPLFWSCIFVLVVFLIVQTLRIGFRSGLRRIPGPFFARFSNFCNLQNAASGEAQTRYYELHQKYGQVVRTGPLTVDISDPDAIPTIYGIQSNFTKSDFYSVFSLTERGVRLADLFTTQDPAIHKIQKRNVSNAYAMSSMLGLENLVDECTQVLIKKLGQKEQESIDLGIWLQWYAFDVIGKITFSKQFGFMEEEKDVRNMIGQIEKGLIYSAVIGQYPSLHTYLFLGNPITKWIFENIPSLAAQNPLVHITEFTRQQINRHEKDTIQEQSPTIDFLSRLREQQKLHPERLSESEVMTHCLTNLLAGSDTTGISLRAVIYFLIKNPRCYEALEKEVDYFDAQGMLSPLIKFNESLNMPYLQASIKEAMRLHPGVGFRLERCVPMGGAHISGHFIPEGTIVGMNAWVVHRDKIVFGEDADQFRPERWIECDEEKLKAMNRAFLSFGHGARSCIGKNISILEMGKVIPQLIRNYTIKMATPNQDWKTENYWFVKQTGLVCRILRRN